MNRRTKKGLFWDGIDHVPEGGIVIPGDPKIVSKNSLFFWRFLQPWCIFEVERQDSRPYYVFFKDENTSMVHRRLVITSRFAARLSHMNLYFAASHNSDSIHSLSISFLPKYYSWLEMNVSTKQWLVNILQNQYLYKHDVTLI